MYEEKDYILRLIHEIIRTLAKLLFHKDWDKLVIEVDGEHAQIYRKLCAMIDDGEINAAENILTDYLDTKCREDFLLALRFYEYLNQKDDDFLAAHGFSRAEVADGLKYAVDFYGYGSMAEAFLEDLQLDSSDTRIGL